MNLNPRLYITSAIAALILTGCSNSTSQPEDVYNLNDEALTQLTREAFTFAYPLVEQYRMMIALTNPQSPVFSADFNHFSAGRSLQGPEATFIIRPNADTLYGGGFLDLRTEPVVIGVPEMEDSRYYSVQLIDSHTHNFGYIGTRTTGNGAGQVMIAGPNWRGETPEGITKVIRTESYVPAGLIRIEVKGEDDLQRVHTLQDAFALTPLSEFLGKEAAAKQQYQLIESEQDQLGQMVNGWLLTSAIFGNREHMQGKYQLRAEATHFGLWGNDLEEAYYPTAMHDANGESLDASKHNYVLHFTADQLPKAKGFWSLTMYNEAQLMYANEIDRYVVGDRSEHLQYGADGSLTIYLQHENPGADKERNWLPTNKGPFTLTMRMYIPEDTSYQPPALQTAD